MTDNSPADEIERLRRTVAALESQRDALGDQVVDDSVFALRRQLSELEAQPRDQQRKQITVLFADVSGFTAMSETLDAEEVGDFMNTLWRRLDAVITDYGGYIDKHIGDAVMALWGVKTAQESDPEMAILAALAMQNALAAFRQNDLHDLRMRIGINTGPVLLGEVGDTAEFTAVGDTVNTADRLEQVAPVGQVLISHNTFQHVRGVFDVTPLEPITVKGKRDPLQVYIVRKAKARSFRTRRRGVEGVETRMIGRSREQSILKETFRSVVNESKRQVITIAGEAGIGKSRLLYEFENWVDLQKIDVLLLRGRARQENQHIPFGLFRDMFAFRFDILEDDSAQVVTHKLTAGFAEQMAPLHNLTEEQIEMRAHFVGHLLGYDMGSSPHLMPVLADARQIRDRAFAYLQGYFQAAGANDPVLVLLEDLQWADDSSLDMFVEGAQVLADLPLLVVGTARPAFYDRRPLWFADRAYQRRLDLRPLPARENRRLVYEILKLADDVPAALPDLIVESSEGNPFYVEELVKMLIEEGAIVKGEDSWQINAENLAALRVPPTLAGILQARLDSLTNIEKAILQQASVIGRVFWDAALGYLNERAHKPLDTAAVEETLLGLLRRELIYKRETSTFGQANEFIFKHAILREVAYESVLLRDRRRYHGFSADWLRAQSRDRSGELVGLTADHLIKAGRGIEAVDDLIQAGKQAAARYANDEAEAYFSRAYELLPAEDIAGRYDLLRSREKTYHLLGKREQQAADLNTLEALAALLSPIKLANVSLRRASYAEAVSDYEAMRLAAENAIAFAAEDGPPAILARSYLEWGIALERTGSYRPAHEQLKRALALAQEAGDRSLAGSSLRGLGIVARAMRRHEEAYRYYQEALAEFVELGDVNAQASTLVWLGVLSTDLGDIARARGYYEQALELTQQTGFRYQESFALSNLGSNANFQGDYARARQFIERALAVAREIDNRIVECLCLNNLATVHLNQGAFAASFTNYEQSLAIARVIGHRSMEASAATGVGHALIRLGDAAAAVDPLQHALHVRRELGEVHEHETLAILAYAYLKMGEPERALVEMAAALHYLEDDGRFFITEFGLRNYLFLLEILETNNDPRAAALLRLAHDELENEAARIPDEPTRRAFRQDVPFHRKIDAIWQAQNKRS